MIRPIGFRFLMPNNSAQSPPYDIAVTLDFEGIRKAQPGIRDSPFRAERVERSKRMRFNPRFLNTTGRGTVQVPA
jgi:hypothetical protein